MKIKKFILPFLLLLLSVVFTICVKTIDVQPVGPENSLVGFASFNYAIHLKVGTGLLWYNITDWLGLVPVFFAFGMAVMGLCQLIARRSLFKVDKKLLILGVFYIIIIAIYIFFEKCIINYRPVLLGKTLEASYPSSHTMITISIIGTGIIFLKDYIKSRRTFAVVSAFMLVVILVTVVGRFISGVHWTTDIIGGLLISAAIISFYKSICDII